MDSPHRIDDLVIDLSFEAAGKRGFAAPDDEALQALVMELMLPALDEALCSHPEDGMVYHIDSLEVDLGDISWDSIRTELPRRVLEAVQQALSKVLHTNAATTGHSVRKVSKSAVDTDVMERFLQGGSLPLHISGGTAIDPETLLDSLLKAGSDDFVRRLRHSPLRFAYATRLAQQFSPRLLRELLQKLAPGVVAERYLGLAEQFEKQVTLEVGTGFAQRHDMRLVWEHLLSAALGEQPPNSVVTRQIGAAAAAAGQVQRLAAIAAQIESAWVIRLAQHAPAPLPQPAAAPISIPASMAAAQQQMARQATLQRSVVPNAQGAAMAQGEANTQLAAMTQGGLNAQNAAAQDVANAQHEVNTRAASNARGSVPIASTSSNEPISLPSSMAARARDATTALSNPDARPILLPATAPSRFTREGLMRALVRGELHGRWDAVVQNQPDLLLEVVHQIGQRDDLWPRVLTKLPDAQLHDIIHLIAPVAASLLRPMLEDPAFFEAAGGDSFNGNHEQWTQSVRMAAFSILFEDEGKLTDARYFAHLMLGKMGGIPRSRYIQLAKAWGSALHEAGSARSLVAAVSALGRNVAAPAAANVAVSVTVAPRDLYEALVATIDDKRRDAGAEGLADALDIATSRDNDQLQQQLKQVRLGAITLGGERFSVLQLQNLITAMLAGHEDATDAGPLKRRASSAQAADTGQGSFQAWMLQEIAANANKAGDERRYLASVLEQLVHGRMLDLEAIVAASRQDAVFRKAATQSSSEELARTIAAGRDAAIDGKNVGSTVARADDQREMSASELRTLIRRALTSDGNVDLISLARDMIRSINAASLGDDGRTVNAALHGDVGRTIGSSLPGGAAEVLSLIHSLMRADRVGGGDDQTSKLAGIVKHARSLPAPVDYLRKVLEVLALGRSVDAGAIAARMIHPAALSPAAAAMDQAPFAKAPVATPDLYQVLLDSLGSAVRSQGGSVLLMELDRLTATATPRLLQWLRQVREGSMVLGGDRFSVSQLKNLIRVQIEGGETPQSAKASASASAFRLSMQQAIEQNAALVADLHRYHKLVLEQLVYGRLLDLEAITARSMGTQGQTVQPKPDPAQADAEGPVESLADAGAPVQSQAPSLPLEGEALRAEIARVIATDSDAALVRLAETLPAVVQKSFGVDLSPKALMAYRVLEAFVQAMQPKGAKRRNVMLDTIKAKLRASGHSDRFLRMVLAELVTGRPLDLEAVFAASESGSSAAPSVVGSAEATPAADPSQAAQEEGAADSNEVRNAPYVVDPNPTAHALTPAVPAIPSPGAQLVPAVGAPSSERAVEPPMAGTAKFEEGESDFKRAQFTEQANAGEPGAATPQSSETKLQPSSEQETIAKPQADAGQTTTAKPHAAGQQMATAGQDATTEQFAADSQQTVAAQATNAKLEASAEQASPASTEATARGQIAVGEAPASEQGIRAKNANFSDAEAAAELAATTEQETAARQQATEQKEIAARQLDVEPQEIAAKQKATKLQETSAKQQAAMPQETAANQQTAKQQSSITKHQANTQQEPAAKQQATTRQERTTKQQATTPQETAVEQQATTQQEPTAKQQATAAQDAEAKLQATTTQEAKAKQQATMAQETEAKQQATTQQEPTEEQGATTPQDPATKQQVAAQRESTIKQKAATQQDSVAAQKTNAHQDAATKQQATVQKVAIAKQEAAGQHDRLTSQKDVAETTINNKAVDDNEATLTRKQEAAAKREVSGKQQTSAKRDVAGKPEAAARRDATVKQEAATKQEATAKQELTTTREAASKQDPTTTREAASKQQVAAKRGDNVEQASHAKPAAQDKAADGRHHASPPESASPVAQETSTDLAPVAKGPISSSPKAPQYVAPPETEVAAAAVNADDIVNRLLQAFATGDFADLYMVWAKFLATEGATLRNALLTVDLATIPWSEVADGFPQSVLDDVVTLLSPDAASTLLAWIEDEVLNELADDAAADVPRPQRAQRLRVAAMIHLLEARAEVFDELTLARVLANAMAESEPETVAQLMAAWTGEALSMPVSTVAAGTPPAKPTRREQREAKAAMVAIAKFVTQLESTLASRDDAAVRPMLKKVPPTQLNEVLVRFVADQEATVKVRPGSAKRTADGAPRKDDSPLHQLAAAVLRADAARDGHDRSKLHDAIVSHSRSSKDSHQFMALVLEDLVNDRVVDLDAISSCVADDTIENDKAVDASNANERNEAVAAADSDGNKAGTQQGAAGRAAVNKANPPVPAMRRDIVLPDQGPLIETIQPGRIMPMRSHHSGWIERALATHPPAIRASLSTELRQADPSAISVEALPQELVRKIVRLLAGTQADALLRCAEDVAQTFMEAYPGSRQGDVTAMLWQYLFVHLFEMRRGFDTARLATGLTEYLLLRHGRTPTDRMKQLVQRRFGVEVADKKDAKPTATSQRSAAEDPLPEEGESIYIGNAGQVLAAPYMPRLFSMLGLLEGGRFKDEEAAERAVHLMQLVVTGKTDAPEYQLGLNKILCGVGSGTPIVREIEATDQEKEVVEALIKGMIGHWKAIGNTSVAGLRETFLQRPGALYLKDDAWQLKVQPGPIDMLLDRLPWSFSIIKHPWMERSVHVTWR